MSDLDAKVALLHRVLKLVKNTQKQVLWLWIVLVVSMLCQISHVVFHWVKLR